MNENRKKELKYLIGFVASLPFGIAGFILVFVTIIPSSNTNKTLGYYVAGFAVASICLGLFYTLLMWAKEERGRSFPVPSHRSIGSDLIEMS